MIDREKQLYLWANPKQTIGEGFIHFEFGMCSPTGSTTGDTSSVTVDLNNQWVASTKKLDASYDVYMSNSNKGVESGYASMKIKFKGKPDFKIWINSYAETSYDYTIAFNMDVDYPTTLPDTNSTGVKLSTIDFQKDPTVIDNFKEVDYPNDGGEHFVVVTYIKDSSGNDYDDRGYVAVKLTPLSTSWVLSSTEFIKENDKYYQRINEVGTYEGGFTGTTGNFKKGNELTPTYIQSSDASDFIIVDGGMYYKKYAYVTPVDNEIYTGDYIQGDYIGEIKPTVVTYNDGTTKEFNISGEIISGSVDNISAATKVDIGNNVTIIGGYAFADCKNLSAVTLPISVKEIKFSAFRNCININSFIVPGNVKEIGDNAFNGCTNLSYIRLPEGINEIINNAFMNCTNLTSITFPASITILNYGICQGCSALASVTIENSTAKFAYIVNSFYGISQTAKLYVPSNLLADYQADTDWTDAFKGGIYAIE